MATHESWQFAFVKETGDGVGTIINLGSKSPLFVEYSNLVVNSVPSAIEPNEVVSGDHIRVYWAMPSNTPTHNLTGLVKILRKPKEFPRSILDNQAETIINVDFSTTIGTLERDSYYLHIDHVESNQILYYTVFYQVTDIQTSKVSWVFSSINGHDRAMKLDSGESAFGNQMYGYMPVGVKQQDREYANLTLHKFFQILGKPFDEIKERLDHFKNTRHKPDLVDASLLPYIDHFIGWPTNFELRETRRRDETANALDVWRNKSVGDALELVLQTLTGWDVEIVESRNYYVTTATAEDAVDLNNAPTGWDNNGDEGSWSEQMDDIPFNGTVSFPHFILQGGVRDTHRVISDFRESGWKNPFDFLLQLKVNSQAQRPLLSSLATQKIKRLLPYLKIFYTDPSVVLTESYSDTFDVTLDTTFVDDSYRPESDSGIIGCSETLLDTGANTFYTYSASHTKGFIWHASLSVPGTHRTFHSHLS